MGRPREFDTPKALHDLQEAFWAGGFEATGLSDLEEATGLARPRLYAAFGSKLDMLHSAIDFYLDNSIEPIVSRVEQGGLDGIANWFQAIAGVRETRPERAAMGCLMVNSMVEFGSTDEGVSLRAARYQERIHSAFTAALEISREAGELDGEVDAKADLALMLLLGMFVAIKSGNDVDHVRRLARVATDTVTGWRKTG